MLTLKMLKRCVEIPKKDAKIPTLQQIRGNGIPVCVRKVIDSGAETAEVTVFVNGYVTYRIGKRVTVFPINLQSGYSYLSVTDVPSGQNDLAREYFDNKEWWLLLMLIGEDRLQHNMLSKDIGVCLSLDEVIEENIFAGDTMAGNFLEDIILREEVDELLEILNMEQRMIVELTFWEGLTQEMIAAKMGKKSRTAVTNMLHRAIVNMKKSAGADGDNCKK